MGGNVIANLLMSPKASPPPYETDAVLTIGHLFHCHHEGHLEGRMGSDMLVVWNMGPPMCSFSGISKTK